MDLNMALTSADEAGRKKKKEYQDSGVRPYDYFHDLLGGRWKLYIIRGIQQQGSIRFNETKRVLGISGRSLQTQLRALENDGLIIRKEYPGLPLHVEYELTPIGKELIPVIDSIYKWTRKVMQERNISEAVLSPEFHKGI